MHGALGETLAGGRRWAWVLCKVVAGVMGVGGR